MKFDAKQVARGRWIYILTNLGMDKKFLTKKHCACPICGGIDRFRFTDTAGDGIYICNQCGTGDGFTLAKKALGKSFKDVADMIRSVYGHSVGQPVEGRREETSVEEHRAMVNTWGKGRKPPENGPVDRYLKARGLTLDGVRNIRQYEGNMIARVCDKDASGVNVHRTFLSVGPSGLPVKSDRKMMKGPIPKGSAVRLYEHEGILGIAEGIETAMSATALFKVPCWSVISASGMENWIPPEDVHTIVIFADNDENFTGQAAAYKAANRISIQHGKKVEVKIPPIAGWDWNDALVRHIKYKNVDLKADLEGRN